MFLWDFFGILLQIGCGVVGGLSSFLLLNWGIYRFQLGLHHRLTEAEGRIERETKIRASEQSRRGRNVEKDLLDQIQNGIQTPPPALTLENWKKTKYGSVQKG
jgi:hypothetical protein